MTLHKHKKFIRSQEPPVNLRIQPRDYELLRDIAEYRFLDTEQILAIYPTSPRNIRKRLSDLYHLGYLERPKSQKLFQKTGTFLIYSLGEKGAELLSRTELAKRNDVSFPYLAHAMMVSQFHATLAVALRKHPTSPKIERWLQSYDLQDALASRGEHIELFPDAFFTIEKEGKRGHFFLEADRSTMTREKVLNKMRIYWQWRDGRLEKNLGVENFRVLTITKSEERAENLRRITKNADDRKTGSSMFLFLSETKYSLKKAEDILLPVWSSPKDDVLRSILE